MSELTKKKEKHLDFLIADFNVIKSEIARRSSLQRIALGAYLGIFAVFANQALLNSMTAPLLVCIWISSFISFQFYIREGLEIRRLGSLIQKRIAPVAVKILGVDIQDLAHSQTNSKFPATDKITSGYNKQFKWLIFLILPLLITIFYLSQDWSRLSRILDFNTRGPYMSICIIIFGGCILRFLFEYAWRKKKEA